jgi:hypothetical protein
MTDAALTVELTRLAACQRETGARLVAHLAEFDARRLYLGAGYPSLFSYCCQMLRLSESGAYNRIEVARAARRVPPIFEMLAEGSLTLATARLLAPHLTVGNAEEILAAAAFKSRRAVEEIVARLAPKPDAPSSVRKLPGRKAGSGGPPSAVQGVVLEAPALRTSADAAAGPTVVAAATVSSVLNSGASTAPARATTAAAADASTAAAPDTTTAAARATRAAAADATTAAAPDATTVIAAVKAASVQGTAASAAQLDRTPSAAQRSVHAPAVTALAPERYQVRFTTSVSTYAKLRSAQELLRHAIPDGDIGQIFDRALTLLLKELTRRRFAAGHAPRGDARGNRDGCGAGSNASRYIPADVRRQVWQRDAGRCAFVGSSGRRCAARGFLEFHHVRPHAAGGQRTVENISLRCRAHNGYEAMLYFEEIGDGRSAEGVAAGTSRARADRYA